MLTSVKGTPWTREIIALIWKNKNNLARNNVKNNHVNQVIRPRFRLSIDFVLAHLVPRVSSRIPLLYSLLLAGLPSRPLLPLPLSATLYESFTAIANVALLERSLKHKPSLIYILHFIYRTYTWLSPEGSAKPHIHKYYCII